MNPNKTINSSKPSSSTSPTGSKEKQETQNEQVHHCLLPSCATAIQCELEQLRRENTSLKQEMSSLKKEKSSVEIENKNLRRENQVLKEANQELNKAIHFVKQQNSQLTHEKAELTFKVKFTECTAASGLERSFIENTASVWRIKFGPLMTGPTKTSTWMDKYWNGGYIYQDKDFLDALTGKKLCKILEPRLYCKFKDFYIKLHGRTPSLQELMHFKSKVIEDIRSLRVGNIYAQLSDNLHHCTPHNQEPVLDQLVRAADVAHNSTWKGKDNKADAIRLIKNCYSVRTSLENL